MPKKPYEVEVSAAENGSIWNLVSSGWEKARKLRRARSLMKADEGWTDREICDALDVSRPRWNGRGGDTCKRALRSPCMARRRSGGINENWTGGMKHT